MGWEDRRSGWTQQPEDARTPFDVDYARIVHSASFRRLQGKTQILNIGDSDFYRTRLTHSLEVAQIADGIVRQLINDRQKHPAYPYLPSAKLVQSVGSAHDLGHPPFGHGGEVALNYCMRGHGGFEGNGQTLRILSRLETFSKDHGADLTRRTLLGVLKYPVPFSRANGFEPALNAKPSAIRLIDREASKPPKCYLDTEADAVAWILDPLTASDRDTFTALEERSAKHKKPLHKSFDCTIMDEADDIAYGVHDLEDAIALCLVSADDFHEVVTPERCSTFLDALKEKYPKESANDVYEYLVEGLFTDGSNRKRFISRMVHHFLTNIEIETCDAFEEPLLRYRVRLKPGHRQFLDALQELVVTKVIESPSVQHFEFKGQNMVVSVFEAFLSDSKSLLPVETYKAYAAAEGDPRVICDHVASMTDESLLRTYDRLFSPRMGSVFDRL